MTFIQFVYDMEGIHMTFIQFVYDMEGTHMTFIQFVYDMEGSHMTFIQFVYDMEGSHMTFIQFVYDMEAGIDLSGFASQFANQNSLAAIRFSFFIAQNCDALQRPVVCSLHVSVVHTAD